MLHRLLKNRFCAVLLSISAIAQSAHTSQLRELPPEPEYSPSTQNTAYLLGAATTLAVVATAAIGYKSYLKFKKPKIWQDPLVQRLLKSQDQQVAIFDMGGVLVTINKTSMGLGKIGAYRFMKYLITHNRSPAFIKKEVTRLYEAVPHGKKLSKEERKLAAMFTEFSDVRNYDGTPLPQLITLFQAGLLSSHESAAVITKRSHELYKNKHYSSKEEKDIMLALAMTPFEPQWFADHTAVIPEGAQLLKRFADRADTIMILSNWDKESFAIMQKKYKKEIFDYIEQDNIFVSGRVHKLKPSEAIFSIVMKAAGCSKDRKCVFFDDQEENLKGARQCGLHAIPCILG